MVGDLARQTSRGMTCVLMLAVEHSQHCCYAANLPRPAQSGRLACVQTRGGSD